MTQRTRNSVRIAIIPTALREARLRLYLSPEDLAEKADVGVGTIKAAEGSERYVHLSTVQALARALDCDPADISHIKREDVA